MNFSKFDQTLRNALTFFIINFLIAIIIFVVDYVFFLVTWIDKGSLGSAVQYILCIGLLLCEVLAIYNTTFCAVVLISYLTAHSLQLTVNDDGIVYRPNKKEEINYSYDQLDHAEVKTLHFPLKNVDREHLYIYVKGQKEPICCRYIASPGAAKGKINKMINAKH